MATQEKNLIPYGVQNFADIRRHGLCCVDKTRYVGAVACASDCEKAASKPGTESVRLPHG